jgi:hypothetical protein
VANASNDDALAVAFDSRRAVASNGQQPLGHHQAKRFEVAHEGLEILEIPADEGFDADRDEGSAVQKIGQNRAAFVQDLLDRSGNPADADVRHGRESLTQLHADADAMFRQHGPMPGCCAG